MCLFKCFISAESECFLDHAVMICSHLLILILINEQLFAQMMKTVKNLSKNTQMSSKETCTKSVNIKTPPCPSTLFS